LDVIPLDRKDLESAGAGETPNIAIAPAIANAVFDATGKPVHSIPIRVRQGSAREWSVVTIRLPFRSDFERSVASHGIG